MPKKRLYKELGKRCKKFKIGVPKELFRRRNKRRSKRSSKKAIEEYKN